MTLGDGRHDEIRRGRAAMLAAFGQLRLAVEGEPMDPRIRIEDRQEQEV